MIQRYFEKQIVKQKGRWKIIHCVPCLLREGFIAINTDYGKDRQKYSREHPLDQICPFKIGRINYKDLL